MSAEQGKAEKLEALREMLQNGPGEPILDPLLEEQKASIRRRALLLLDQRARSRAELQRRLRDLDFDPEIVDEVLADLERVNLIDDELFAREWVRQRHQVRGKSRRHLDRELQEKGVAPALRTAALEQIEPEDEADTARTLAEKKARSIRQAPADRKEYDKYLRRIVGVLARRGYSEGLSFHIAKTALDNRIAEL